MSVTRIRTKTLLTEQGHEQNTVGAAATATSAAATKSKSPSTAAQTTNAANNLQQGGNTLATSTKTKTLVKSGIAATTTTTTIAAATTTVITTNASTTQQQQQQQQQQLQPQPHQQQQQQQTYLPQTSLLKIEPFVPSFNSRSRPPHIYRSHSTLSSTNLKRSSLNYINATQTPPIDQLKQHHFVVGSAIDGLLPKSTRTVTRMRHQPRRNAIMRQRSKSNSSSASALPVAGRRSSNHQLTGGETFASSSSPTTSVTQQPNGICRIARPLQEQEKLPDRINYDRRGLTAIPIFEHEPNLRLLSLQHNLINVFHIPKEQQEEDQQEEACNKSPTAVDKPAAEDSNQSGRALLNGRSKLAPQLPTNSKPSPPPLPQNLCAQQALGLQSLNQMGPLSTHLPLSKSTLRGSSFLQRSALYSAQQQQLLQQQQPPQGRFNMKKSKSFIFNNSSRHLSGMRQNLSRSQLPERTESKLIAALSATNLLSFDSGAGASVSTTTTDSNSTLAEEQAQLQEQLQVKNKQLVATYGQIFQNLVFLDLYDNQIERITNLDGLPMLSVLLLGKNRITDISGISSLKSTLRVLDLHGNKITSLSNKINCLQELKSLNLAGNQIRLINNNDFCNLLNLKELNLKRNRIKRINGFQHLTALERLWLCHNDLHKVEDMSTIAKALNLLEVTIENNPVSLAGDCVSFLVSYLPRLQSLSQMPITDQVRRAAMAWRKNKEHSDANYSHLSSDVFNSIRREEVISNARTNWELLRSQQTIQQGAQRQKRSPQQRELARINESSEANGSVEYEKMQEFLKLPPIQQPELEMSQAAGACDAAETGLEHRTTSSNSSLGPNIDSSSSCYSSGDNEATESPHVAGRRQARRSYPTAERARSSKQAADVSNNRNNSNQCQVKITTMPPDAQQQKLDQANATDSKPNGTPAASQNPKDVLDNAPRLNDSNLSELSNSNAATTTPNLATQAEKPSSKQRAAALDKQPPRGATTTTPITANSSTLSLGFHNNSGSANPTPRMLAAPTSNPKRYMQGSLMRSHTIVGGGGGGGGGGKVANSSNKANLNQSQQNHQQNLSTNNVTDQNRTANNSHPQALACIVAPATTQPATTTTMATTTSKTNSIINQTTSNASAATTTTTTTTSTSTGTGTCSKQVTEREREQGGDYLIEICGRYLNVYGQGALRYIDKQWNPLKANDVHTLNFSYINFNNIATILGRIKSRFPHAENFVFRETNISCLGQLNALAELQGIATLCIDPEGNAITTKDLWRLYAVYRLSHWGLKLLNGVEVSEAEMEAANTMYAGLSDLVLWSMPEAMLQPLLARLRLDETCSASKLTPKEWLMKADKSLRIVVGKEALQWKKSTAGVTTTNMTTGAGGNAGACAGHHQHNDGIHAGCVVGGGAAGVGGTSSSLALAASCCTTRERAKLHFATMMENTCNAVEKLHKLETLWPTLLQDIVRNTLLDFSQMDVYLRNLMSEIMK